MNVNIDPGLRTLGMGNYYAQGITLAVIFVLYCGQGLRWFGNCSETNQIHGYICVILEYGTNHTNCCHRHSFLP